MVREGPGPRPIPPGYPGIPGIRRSPPSRPRKAGALYPRKNHGKVPPPPQQDPRDPPHSRGNAPVAHGCVSAGVSSGRLLGVVRADWISGPSGLSHHPAFPAFSAARGPGPGHRGTSGSASSGGRRKNSPKVPPVLRQDRPGPASTPRETHPWPIVVADRPGEAATAAHRCGSGAYFVMVTVVRVRTRTVRGPAGGKPGNSPSAPAAAATMGHRCCSAGPGNRNDGPWMLFPQQRWPIDAVTRPGRAASVARRCGSPRGHARFAAAAAGKSGAAPGGQRTRSQARAGDLPVLRLVWSALSRCHRDGLDPERQPVLSLPVVTITKCEPEPSMLLQQQRGPSLSLPGGREPHRRAIVAVPVRPGAARVRNAAVRNALAQWLDQGRAIRSSHNRHSAHAHQPTSNSRARTKSAFGAYCLVMTAVIGFGRWLRAVFRCRLQADILAPLPDPGGEYKGGPRLALPRRSAATDFGRAADPARGRPVSDAWRWHPQAADRTADAVLGTAARHRRGIHRPAQRGPGPGLRLPGPPVATAPARPAALAIGDGLTRS